MNTHKILLTELRQESNAFSPMSTTVESWREGGWMLEAGDVYKKHRLEQSALGGMIRFLEDKKEHAELVYGPGFYSQSGGVAEDNILELYWAKLSECLAEKMPLDMVLFSFHGALQTASYDDAEAEILRRARSVVGAECLLVASADLHAFISDSFIDHVDLLCGYQTYPHIDILETGYRAAQLGMHMLLQPDSISVCYSKIPMLASAAGYDSYHEPFKGLIDEGHEFIASGECLDFSVFLMQPWLDVQYPTSIVITVGMDAARTGEISERLAHRAFEMRKQLRADVTSIGEIINKALDSSSRKPILLAETADSTNAGSTGDSMAVVAELFTREQRPRTATIVVDADAVALAHSVGVGAYETFTIGGTLNPMAVKIKELGRVHSLHDGAFMPEGVASAGSHIELGLSAVIQFDNIDVLVCERIKGNGDPQLYKAFGLDPAMYDLVVIKANTSFRAGYSELAGEIYIADAAGPAAPRIEKLKFNNMITKVYPFADFSEFHAHALCLSGISSAGDTRRKS